MKIALMVFLISLLTACAAPAPLEFYPNNVLQSKRKLDMELKTISVKTSQINQKGEVDWFRVENTIGDQFSQTSTGTGVPITRQWEAALSDALNQSLIFRDNAPKTVSLIVEVEKVKMSGLATVDYDVAAKYRLMDRETGIDAYSKTIESRGSAQTNEAFVGSVRARLAFVRSVKANIEQFLADMQASILP